MDVNLTVILLAALVASASPGPATLSIAGTSMASGRRAGLCLAAGIMSGSLIWSVSAAIGLAALMQATGWILELVRYVGAAYLMYLAFKSAKSALSAREADTRSLSGSMRTLYFKGLALHLTNPKAILFFGALYSIGLPPDASASQLLTVIVAVGLQSMIVFHGYAFLFSVPVMTRIYLRLRRGFEAVFALGFGLAGLKIMTARLS